MLVQVATRVTADMGSIQKFTIDISMDDLSKAIYTHNNEPQRSFLWFTDEQTNMALIIPVQDLLWIKPAEEVKTSVIQN